MAHLRRYQALRRHGGPVAPEQAARGGDIPKRAIRPECQHVVVDLSTAVYFRIDVAMFDRIIARSIALNLEWGCAWAPMLVAATHVVPNGWWIPLYHAQGAAMATIVTECILFGRVNFDNAQMNRKGIVLYDFMAVNGGAEKLTQTLLDGLPGTDLCAAFVNNQAFSNLGSQGGRVFDLRAHSRLPLWRILKVIRAFEHRAPALDHYAWAVFSGIYAPVAVSRRRRGRNYLYCHTTPRFCFDLRAHYMRKLPGIARPLLLALIAYVTRKYRQALARMDVVVANSENVRRRLIRHFDRDAIVVNPPVDTRRFQWLGEGDYYISLARLEDFKRVDVIVQAFRKTPRRKLVVASGGTELDRLKQLAAGAQNISFLGWVPEERLRDCVGHARAAVYIPIDEDFGMSPVEAMAAGKPVIGVAEGGLLETVVDGQTGLLIEGRLTPEKVCDAVDRLERLSPSSMRAACEQRAALFDKRLFMEKTRALLS